MSNDPTEWGLPPARTGTDAAEDLIQRRAMVREYVRPEPEVGVTCTDRDWAGTPSMLVEVPGARGRIVYFHGGGFRLGHPRMWAGFASRLGLAAGMDVVVPDYALAPEEPYPNALRQAAAAYDAALAGGGPVVVGGDSAGGGLAASLAVACASAGRTMPVAALLISPWVDMRVTASTYDSRAATDTLFSREAALEASGGYLQGAAAHDPLVSPLLADLDGFPPTMILAGGDEVLLEDSLELARRLALAGTSVELHVAAGEQHVWPSTEPATPGALAATARMGEFIRRCAGA